MMLSVHGHRKIKRSKKKAGGGQGDDDDSEVRSACHRIALLSGAACAQLEGHSEL